MKRLADEIRKGLTEFRDALRDGTPLAATTMVRCEKCRKPVRAKETRGGWCDECNKSDAGEGKGE